MSVTIPLNAVDNVTPIARRARHEVDRLGQSAGRANAQLMAMGRGAAAGVGGRVGQLGGISMAGGMAAGGVAMGAMALAAVVRGLIASSDRSANLAAGQLQVSQQLAAAIRTSQQNVRGIAAGGASMIGTRRQMTARGLSTDITDSRFRGMGSASDIMAAEIAAHDAGGLSGGQITDVRSLVNTGEMSLPEAVKAIGAGRSPVSALAERTGQSQDRARAMISRGSFATHQNMREERIFEMQGREPRASMLALNVGDTNRAVEDEASNRMDGGRARAISELRRAASEVEARLLAAAAAQGFFGNLMEAFGNVVGVAGRSAQYQDELKKNRSLWEAGTY